MSHEREMSDKDYAELWKPHENLRKQLAAAEAECERLFDLVRYQRAELHEAGLITDDEYAKLASAQGSVQRLEGYDALRAECERLRAEVASLKQEREEVEEAWSKERTDAIDGRKQQAEQAVEIARLRAAMKSEIQKRHREMFERCMDCTSGCTRTSGCRSVPDPCPILRAALEGKTP
jgi:predicted  nucleic acid-binding Zn-ribbon protein